MKSQLYYELISKLSMPSFGSPLIDVDDNKISEIINGIKADQSPQWKDFELLDELLDNQMGRNSSIVFDIVHAMAVIVERLTPSAKVRHLPPAKPPNKSLSSGIQILSVKCPWTDLYSDSRLMVIATDTKITIRNAHYFRGGLGSLGGSSVSESHVSPSLSETNTRINAAVALRTITMKIGDQLPDVAEIMKKLLQADIKEVRIVGANISRSSDDKWISDIENIGLISALYENKDLAEKSSIVEAVANGTKKLLKKGFQVDFLRNKNLENLLSSMIKDEDSYLRINASYLLAVTCSISPSSHDSLEGLFLDLIENDSEQMVKQNALGGIIEIFKKRQISNSRLPTILTKVMESESSSDDVKKLALGSIGNYLFRTTDNFSQFDGVILKSINDEKYRKHSLYALAGRLNKGIVENDKLLPTLITAISDKRNSSVKRNAFFCIVNYLKWSDIDDPNIKSVLRKNFKSTDEKIRSCSIEAFGRKLLYEAAIELDNNDIPILLVVGEGDLSEYAKRAATFSLATMIVKDSQRIQEPEIQDRIENLCRQYKHANNTPKIFSKTINYALMVLEANLEKRKMSLKSAVQGESLELAESLFKRDTLQTQTIDSLSSHRFSIERIIKNANRKIDELQGEHKSLAYHLQHEKLTRKELELKLEKLSDELQVILRSDTTPLTVKEAATQLVLGVFEQVLHYKGIDPTQLIKDAVLKAGIHLTMKPFVPKVVGISYQLLGLLLVL